MAELATIARPYADALFKVSTQQGADLSGTVAWAEELAAIAANPQLRQLADDPKVTDEQLFDVISGVAGSALPDAARNFLRVIIENGRLQALPEVAAQFRSLVNRAGGRGSKRIPHRCCRTGRTRDFAGEAFRPKAEPVGAARSVPDRWHPRRGG